MEHLLSVQNQILGVDDRNNWNDLQSNLCGVIVVRAFLRDRTTYGAFSPIHSQSIIRMLDELGDELVNRIMTNVLQLIQSAGKTSTILEDAFLVVGSLAACTSRGFFVCFYIRH